MPFGPILAACLIAGICEWYKFLLAHISVELESLTYLFDNGCCGGIRCGSTLKQHQYHVYDICKNSFLRKCETGGELGQLNIKLVIMRVQTRFRLVTSP